MTSNFSAFAKKQSIIALLCLCSLTVPAAPVSAAQVNNSKSTATNTTPLKGSVQATILKTEVGLKELLESVKAIRRVSMDIIGEVERHDLVVVGEPDVIGPIVMPAIPNPTGTMQMGDALEPRKKWLNIYMSQLDQLVTFLRQEVKAVVIPPDKQSEVNNYWTEIRRLTVDLNQHYKYLKLITVGPDYDNLSIGHEALGIYDDTSKFDKPLKEVYKIIRQ